ncbi:MAG: hypothetical protein L3K52_16995 [Candidatus Thiothrix sulfatifontis]|nr:MAG: hypothetical protein L3K52_16995 [Candidatus Thiothrix sulfatifontis]
MNKKILIFSIAAILATPSAFAAYKTGAATDGTDADDTQTVTVTVPQVALLDVIDASGEGAMTITVDDTSTDAATKIVTPKNAGEAFTGSQKLTGVTYKLSSNVAAAGSTTRTLQGKLNAALPAGWKLSVKVAKPDGTDGTEIPFNGTTNVDLVDAIGNTRTATTEGVVAARAIEYILAPDSTGMMAHATGQTVTVTYTLTAG